MSNNPINMEELNNLIFKEIQCIENEIELKDLENLIKYYEFELQISVHNNEDPTEISNKGKITLLNANGIPMFSSSNINEIKAYMVGFSRGFLGFRSLLKDNEY